jgi:hypothetical protein
VWCQAASTSSLRAWVVPVLVIEPWERDWPEEDSVGHQPDERADGGTGEPVPVTDLNRQRKTGQCGDAAQAAEPAHHQGVAAVGSHLIDGPIETVPPVPGSPWPRPACKGAIFTAATLYSTDLSGAAVSTTSGQFPVTVKGQWPLRSLTTKVSYNPTVDLDIATDTDTVGPSEDFGPCSGSKGVSPNAPTRWPVTTVASSG